MTKTQFYTIYNRPSPVCHKPDTEHKFVDQSEADRCSLKYQLERFGFDTLQNKLEKTRAQFGYADTRAIPNFADYSAKISEANSYFHSLPSQIRKSFGHDPVEFFTSIEKDPEQAFKCGYISQSMYESLMPKELLSNVKLQPSAMVEQNPAPAPVNPAPAPVENVSA